MGAEGTVMVNCSFYFQVYFHHKMDPSDSVRRSEGQKFQMELETLNFNIQFEFSIYEISICT
jgi:hypothetical protein